MMSYYDNAQWTAGSGQGKWDHQNPLPARSSTSAAISPEPAAFSHQLEEVDRAVDNLLKSGKMIGGLGSRSESLTLGPIKPQPAFDPRMGCGPGQRPQSMADFSDARGPQSAANLQNFYAAQRHQSSRGSNEAENMMQAKRRMAAQRERELRNFHQEQQYNRNVLADLSPYKPDRALSPGSMSEDERRDLIARQRSALYGEGSFAETGGYIDETGTPRSAAPGAHSVQATVRGHSPLAYDYGRPPPAHVEAANALQLTAAEAAQPSQAGPNQPKRSRANSNTSPRSNPPANRSFEPPGANRTSNSSPGGSPPRHSISMSKPGHTIVAPIGTRPLISGASFNPVPHTKRSTTPLPSSLSQVGYTDAGKQESTASASTGSISNPTSANVEGPNVGLPGWGSRPGVWGNPKSGLSVQASVWG